MTGLYLPASESLALESSRADLRLLRRALNDTLAEAALSRALLTEMTGPTAKVLLRGLDEGTANIRQIRDVVDATLRAGRTAKP